MKITIASWNVLNDWSVPKVEPQNIRIPEICRTINSIRRQDNPFLIFICECESLENASLIAKSTGLVMLGEPGRSRKRKEYNFFLADKETAKLSKQSRIVIGEDPFAIFRIDVLGRVIMGCHMPVEFIRLWKKRQQFTDKILENQPDIFMGDLNALPFFKMRRRFMQAGYKESHVAKRPIFPSPDSRTKNNSRLIPNVNLDAMYHVASLSAQKANNIQTKVSDHPLIWATFDI